jgi:hypothetical protein
VADCRSGAETGVKDGKSLLSQATAINGAIALNELVELIVVFLFSTYCASVTVP